MKCKDKDEMSHTPVRVPWRPMVNVWRPHLLMGIFLGFAATLRILVMAAYRPALFFPDSADYLSQAHRLSPVDWHPLGYPLFLAPLVALHQAWVVTAAQHLLGLAMGLGLYLLLCRFGVRPWLAAFGALPVLLDPAQLVIEQYVLSETLFEACIVGGLLLLLWRRQAPWWTAALVGVVFAYAACVRFTGLVLLLPAVAFLVLIRAGWSRVLLLTLAFVVPVVAYASWYDSVWGHFRTSNLQSYFLYSRTAPIADCSTLHLTNAERALCPTQPLNNRPDAGWFTGNTSSLAYKLTQTAPSTAAAAIQSFNLAVITQQPVDYVWHAVIDSLRPFGLKRDTATSDNIVATRLLPRFANNGTDHAALTLEMGGTGHASLDRPLTHFLVDYQKFSQVPGPLLLAALVLAAASILGCGRSRGSQHRAEVFALSATPVAIVVFSVVGNSYVWRYSLPLLILAPAAGVLALSTLWPRRFGQAPAPLHQRLDALPKEE